MSGLRLPSLAIAIATALLFSAPEAEAMTIAENDELTLELRGLGEAGYIVADNFQSPNTGPYVGMARLAARATYKDLGRLFAQYEASSGQANLLVLLAVLYITANLHAGAFNPRPFGEAAEGAVLLAARGELKWPFGLGLHVGYSDHFGTMDPTTPDDPFFVRQPQLISGAATFQTTHWFAHLEAVVAPGIWPAGVYAALAYRTGDLKNELSLEPIVGYDYVLPETNTPTHRARAGLNAYLLDYRVVPNIHYEMTINGVGDIGHALLALLRMSL